MNDDDNPLLEDLNVRTIRAKNNGVDEELTAKEEKIEDLRSEIAEKEQKVESLKSEKETATELLKQFRDNQKGDHLDRIKQANAVVDDDEEVDLSGLEEADVGVLETVADRMEKLAEAASNSGGVSNANNTPDLSNVDSSDVDGNPHDEMAEVADDLNMGEAYQKLQANDFGGPQQIGGASEENDLEKAIRDAVNGGGA